MNMFWTSEIPVFLCLLSGLLITSVHGIFLKLPWLDHINTNERNYGVAVSDVNHDGKFDWIVAGYSDKNFVLTYNTQLRRLENIAQSGSPYESLMDPDGNAIGVCACDIDGDGKEEIYFLNTNNAYAGRASYGDKLFKWRNGTYVDLYADHVNKNILAKGFAGRSVACIDRKGTGKYSIIIATYSSGGSGKFALIEMNEDHQDNNIQKGIIVLQNVAAEAGIERSTGGRGVTVGPILSQNGRSDIFFVNEGNPWMGNLGSNFLFKNHGNGSFKDVARDADILDAGENGRGVTLGDFNRDGLIDIVYGNWQGPHRLYLQDTGNADRQIFRNVATSDFSNPSPIRTVITADFNNDGTSEILFNNIRSSRSGPQPNRLFKVTPHRNRKDVYITNTDIGDAVESDGSGTGGAICDIDGDGYLELLLSHGESFAQPLQVYKSRVINSYRWLRVYPTTKYGAPARGAVVKIMTANKDFQQQVIDGGSGYLCQMEPIAHFGLGSDYVIELIVQWPDGKVFKKSLQYLDMNKLHHISYPESGHSIQIQPIRISDSQKCGRYSRKPVAMTECVEGSMNVTVARHPKAPTTCPEFKTFSKPCRPPYCKYNRRTRNVADCDLDTNTETITESLKKAVGNIQCNATRSYVRPCKMIGECMYKDMYNYGECDNSTGKATGTLKLKKRTGTEDCEENKMVKLPCDVAAMRMEKMAEWKAKKQQKRMEKKQKRKEAKKARKAKKRERKANKRQACKYSAGPWSQCDQTRDTISRTLTLSRGNPEKCGQVKVLYRKCRKSCKYKAGRWGKCDRSTNIRQRTDTLKENSESYCKSTRIITKKCGSKKNNKANKAKKKQRKQKKNKNKKCIYEKKGEWSQCDPTTNKRTKTKLLKSGNPEVCLPQKIVTKSCVRPNGERKCLFGEWMEWGDCMNGVRTKKRIVKDGGDDCQRKAVKTKGC